MLALGSGVHLETSTGPSASSRLKDIFVALRFEPLAAQQAVGILE